MIDRPAMQLDRDVGLDIPRPRTGNASEYNKIILMTQLQVTHWQIKQ